MGKLDDIQSLIYQLDKDERSRLREWFDEFDGDSWDSEINSDVKSKKLDKQLSKAQQNVNDGKFKDV
jgi:hypothetical protein